MMKMQQKKNQQNGQRNVMLTVSNALDQSEKQRIEVAGNVTIAQAVKDQGLAPTGAFDVFDAAGKVVSDTQARNLTDENVYVGVQRVAGGADWDAGWGGGAAVEIEPAIEVQDEAPGKGICFVSAFNDNSRNTVIPAEQDTVRACAESSGLTPRDGSAWDVFDDMGRVVTDEMADGLVGKTLWISPAAIGGGAGVPVDRIDELRTDYPSLRAVRGREVNGSVQMFVLRLPDGENRTDDGHYECVVDVSSGPMTYVLNWPPGKGQHPHVYTQATVPGTRRSCLSVCQGNVNQILAASADPIEKIGAYLNHIISVLNS
jgi:hypothetical protein